MGQSGPTYPHMAVTPHGIFSQVLTERYGTEFCWPMLWYKSDKLIIDTVSFEIIRENQTNANVSAELTVMRSIDFRSHLLNYLSSPRTTQLITGNGYIPDYLSMAISPQFSKTYDYITSSARRDPNLNTIDVDYLWSKQGRNKGLEVSTFYVEMTSKSEAERLVRYFVEKRASTPRAHQFHILAQASSILNADLHMVFVNTVGRSSNVKVDGNAYWFPLNAEQAQRLHGGSMPTQAQFGTLNSFLDTL